MQREPLAEPDGSPEKRADSQKPDPFTRFLTQRAVIRWKTPVLLLASAFLQIDPQREGRNTRPNLADHWLIFADRPYAWSRFYGRTDESIHETSTAEIYGNGFGRRQDVDGFCIAWPIGDWLGIFPTGVFPGNDGNECSRFSHQTGAETEACRYAFLHGSRTA